MWDSDPKTIHATMEDALGPRAAILDISYKAMFGGIIAYTCGRPFASLSNAGLAVKLTANDRQALMEKDGGYALRYKPDDPGSKSYTVIPKILVDANGALLEKWLIRSIEHSKIQPLKKKKPRKPKKTKV